jgi:PAT family beta-lactamase induction signal transducer AmpG
VICPFSDFLRRFGRRALPLLVFVAVFRITDLAMASMSNPLYIDLGFSLATIANVSKVFGIAMSITGGLLGGLLVARYGVARMLVVAAVIAALTTLLFSALALAGSSLPMLVLAIVGDNLANGLSSAVFIAFLSALTSRAYTATQYALFSSLMTLPGKFISGFGGVFVASQGYPAFFALAALLGLPSIALAMWVGRDRQLRAALPA